MERRHAASDPGPDVPRLRPPAAVRETPACGSSRRSALALIGRNGSGKIVAAESGGRRDAAGRGRRLAAPGLRVARLAQDVAGTRHSNGPRTRWPRVCRLRTATTGTSRTTWTSCSPGCRCPPTVQCRSCPAAGGGGSCSDGRWCREPDLLLLDEPTNHLDIDAIEWLEEHLRDFAGRAAVRHPRPRVPAPSGDAHHRARSRRADVMAGRATTRTSRRRRRRSRPRRAISSGSTRSSRRRKPGCAAASRRGARATKGACAR